MRTRHRTHVMALVALTAAVSLGCGGSLSTFGDSDTEDDTDTGDTTMDVSPDGGDVVPDVEPDAEPDAEPDTALDVEPDTAPDLEPDSTGCPPGASRCHDGDLQTCPDGSGWVTTPCEYGCIETPDPHCGDWVPSNIPAALLTVGSGNLGPGNPSWDPGIDTVYIDTDDGSIEVSSASDYWVLREDGEGMDADSGIHFEIVEQSGPPPDIGVFSVAEMELPAGVTVWTTGDNAFALAATGDVAIEGTFNCKGYFDSMGRMYPGPGGHPAGDGPGAGGDGSPGDGTADGGGGGAGYGGAGGEGGLLGDTGGAGGAPYGDPALVPLLGGSGGGDGADEPGDGGPGGGACMFISQTQFVIEADGVVDAAGHGGEGADSRGGGGGAGSGGGLLVESPVISIQGILAANGGGGGSGAVNSTTPGTDGQRGQAGTEAAYGGVNSIVPGYGCAGGNGSSADVIDGHDSVCDGDDEDGGGGGGGAGRIRLNGHDVDPGTDSLSPALDTGAASLGPLPLV